MFFLFFPRIMKLGIVLLIMAISLSPRIPLDIVIPGRRFDLRFEDIILTMLLLFWLLYLLLRPKIYLTPLFKALGIYIVIVIFTTSIAIMTLNLSPIRSILYLLKEVEYFIIFFLVANWIRSASDLKLMSGLLLFAGLLNAIWMGFQFITSQKSFLFFINKELTADVYQNPTLLESYGPHLIGEASPLSTGGFFLLVFLLALNFLIFYKEGNRKWLYAVSSVSFFACLALSFSRVSMLGAVFGATTLLSQVNQKGKIKIITLLIIILVVTALLMNQLGYFSPGGRLQIEGIERSLHVRIFEIWQPLMHQGFNGFLVGFGKGALGVVEGLEATEAHNHYLRVFIESGFWGLLAFVYLLAMIIFLSTRVLKEGKLAISKVAGGATLAATVGLGIAALLQDVFTPVILNEFWWIFVGLTIAAHRIEFCDPSCLSKEGEL